MNDMIPVLGIPHYNRPDLLLRCINSIDYPVDTLVLVQNSTDADMPQFTKPDCVQKIVHIKHPNAGCAASWNEMITLFPAKWWLISGNDIQFTPGDLAKMADAAWKNDASDKPNGAIVANHNFAVFILTDKCVEKVGLFDINFFPVFYEDCDYFYRLRLAGVGVFRVPDVNMVHGDNGTVSNSVRSDEHMNKVLGEILRHNVQYYTAKWGGTNEHETYTHPFNNPNYGCDYWRFLPEHRAAAMQNLKKP